MTEKKIDPGVLRFLEENYLDDEGNFNCPCCKARDELIRERGEIVKLLEEQVAKYQRLFPPAKMPAADPRVLPNKKREPNPRLS